MVVVSVSIPCDNEIWRYRLFRVRVHSSLVGQAVTAVGAYVLFHVTLALDDASVGVVSGTVVVVRTLAQRVCIDLVQQLQPLAHREQPARLLPLASQPLQHITYVIDL